MFRSIPFIVAALQVVSPRMSDTTAKSYAKVLQQEAKEHHFDPVTVISLVQGESGWNPASVNSRGCVGLGQICLSNFKVCQNGQMKSAACQAKKRQLQNGIYNLQMVAQAISANRRFCNKKTNKTTKKSRSQWRHWLPSYGGYNKPSQGIWCGQKRVKGKWVNVKVPKRIRQYMERRKRIIRAVSRKLR